MSSIKHLKKKALQRKRGKKDCNYNFDNGNVMNNCNSIISDVNVGSKRSRLESNRLPKIRIGAHSEVLNDSISGDEEETPIKRRRLNSKLSNITNNTTIDDIDAQVDNMRSNGSQSSLLFDSIVSPLHCIPKIGKEAMPYAQYNVVNLYLVSFSFNHLSFYNFNFCLCELLCFNLNCS